VGPSTVKVEWRSASVGCGGECVTIHGVLMMPELCAGNWGFPWECLAQVNVTSKCNRFILHNIHRLAYTT